MRDGLSTLTEVDQRLSRSAAAFASVPRGRAAPDTDFFAGAPSPTRAPLECGNLGATLSSERYWFGFEIDSASADVRAGGRALGTGPPDAEPWQVRWGWP